MKLSAPSLDLYNRQPDMNSVLSTAEYSVWIRFAPRKSLEL